MVTRTRGSTASVTGEYVTASVGIKIAVSVLLPSGGTLPALGLYVNVPGTMLVAFSCELPNGVP